MPCVAAGAFFGKCCVLECILCALLWGARGVHGRVRKLDSVFIITKQQQPPLEVYMYSVVLTDDFFSGSNTS